jgi:septation ring formation regulator EzrA
MTQALEAAKRARDRGVNVSTARVALKEARSAFERGDYARAMELADYLLAQLGSGTENVPPSMTTPPSPPGAADLGAAAGRLAEAAETVKQAKTRGFNVQVAKAALKQAKRAFKAKDYGATVQLASQAIELSGSTGRVRP